MSQKSSMMISAISMNDKVTGSDRKQFNVGTYDGMEVYYQKLEKDTIVLDRAVREEVSAVRELKHANICIIIGCCILFPNVAIITELQPKGSLEDLFGNDDIKLPWNFKFGLIKGIVAGLQFIHARYGSSNFFRLKKHAQSMGNSAISFQFRSKEAFSNSRLIHFPYTHFFYKQHFYKQR